MPSVRLSVCPSAALQEGSNHQILAEAQPRPQAKASGSPMLTTDPALFSILQVLPAGLLPFFYRHWTGFSGFDLYDS